MGIAIYLGEQTHRSYRRIYAKDHSARAAYQNENVILKSDLVS